MLPRVQNAARQQSLGTGCHSELQLDFCRLHSQCTEHYPTANHNFTACLGRSDYYKGGCQLDPTQIHQLRHHQCSRIHQTFSIYRTACGHLVPTPRNTMTMATYVQPLNYITLFIHTIPYVNVQHHNMYIPCHILHAITVRVQPEYRGISLQRWVTYPAWRATQPT